MDTTPPGAETGKPPRPIPFSPPAAVLLAISIGLGAGYLDLLVMFFMKSFWDEEGYFRTGRDFLWTCRRLAPPRLRRGLAAIASRPSRGFTSHSARLRLSASRVDSGLAGRGVWWRRGAAEDFQVGLYIGVLKA